MKLKSFFLLIFIAGITSFSLSSCNDTDYIPVFLVNANNTANKIENNSLILDAFNEGEEFHIKGGDGHYSIQNLSNDIIDFRYDGKVLTLIPVGIGIGSLQIEDGANNRITLSIQVKFYETTYQVTRVKAEVMSNELPNSSKRKLEDLIAKDSFVKENGKYVFTFTDAERTAGNATIYPEKISKPLSGLFFMEKKSNEQGQAYDEYTIILTDKTVHTMRLTPNDESSNGQTVFKEDVTDAYLSSPQETDKAWLIHEVSF